MNKLGFLFFIPLALWAESSTIEESFERAIAQSKSEACEKAKELARKNYNIVRMNAGCTCERTDGRQWLCDVGFTYKKEK